MSILFYVASAVAILATGLALTRAHPVHALLYFIVSLFATATVFFLLGAPFVAALEVIVYAGAIIVVFLFVVMMLNLDPKSEDLRAERGLLVPVVWVGPALLALVLGIELMVLIQRGTAPSASSAVAIGPKAVAAALYGPYLVAVELASLLLLAGLVAAYHVARRGPDTRAGEARTAGGGP